MIYEVNFDGLVGVTHHYAGLSFGNIASMTHAKKKSNPRAAALEGLSKMRLLHKLGIKQAVLPPHPRPNLNLLYDLGFEGTPMQQIQKVSKIAPELLSACYSASSMWAANAATVSSSVDTKDKRVHFTAANLISQLHRSQEANMSHKLLKYIFSNNKYFTHHNILPAALAYGDEGAANYNRIAKSHSDPGLHIFVYGKQGLTKFPARQSLEASKAIARNHQLNQNKVLFACQNPKAIEAGVFHNDVISVANEYIFLVHEEAFLDQKNLLRMLKLKANFLQIIEIPKTRISLKDAVSSYLFNSQLVTLPDNSMALIAPEECLEIENVSSWIDEIITDSNNPINSIYYINLRQSMQNGGGPACLRLRVPLTPHEFQNMHQGVIITDKLLDKLEAWVKKYHPEGLDFGDLCSSELFILSSSSFESISAILELDKSLSDECISPLSEIDDKRG